ncbi:hypothetical protein CKM354_000202600 [Cercospora kikuchii]|uniref:Flavin reductase like domain-containing protein n=1 Tax=Cercospora kikuchii TaxID=84275 RepID=A0A9P3C911_9PEZI|nr:uncharacterized protein CKM354_000202600 [Cercospora kikuchii]GIZ38614.1 hypothetical protein CKM354_000202600 [Cercospora kikuchii]
MTRMSVASRRFYRAFYEWTLLTSPAEVGAERSCSHGFHSTAAKHKTFPKRMRRHAQREHGREVLRAPQDERLWTRCFDSPQERTAIGIPDAEEKLQFAYEAAIGRPPPKMRELQKYIERWKNALVHQATDKPFNTLQPWEEVVRYRSEMGIMLEVPVLDRDLERLQGEYRSGLETLVLAFESRIEVQQLSAPVKVRGREDAKIVSVLVSGTYMAVARTYHEFLAYTSDLTARLDKSARSDAKEPDLEDAELSSRLDARADQPATLAPMKRDVDGSVVPTAEQKSSASDMGVYPQATRPSSDLVPRGYLVRQVEGSHLQIEMSVSESDWTTFHAQNNVERFASEQNVSITVGEPEQRPVHSLSSDKAMARSLFISGDKRAVMRTRLEFFSCMSRKGQNGPEFVARTSRLDEAKAQPQTSERAPRVYSQLVRPSSSLVVRGYVVRQLEGTYMQIEMCVPEGDYLKFTTLSSVEDFAEKRNVSITVGESEPRPIHESSSDTTMARSLTISGPKTAVMNTRHIFLDQVAWKRPDVPDSKQDEDVSTTSYRPNHAGDSAENFQYYRTKLVGPFSKKLKKHLLIEKIARNRDRVSVQSGPGSELVLIGRRARIEEVLQRLAQRATEICETHNFGTHELQSTSSAIKEVVGRRPQDCSLEVFVHGPNAKDLWPKIMEGYVEGCRIYGNTAVLVQKTERTILFTGAHDGTSLARERFEQRVKDLCNHHGYEIHEVTSEEGPARPDLKAESLMDRFRSTLRTLTHPVVLITSGRFDEATKGSKHERILGARGVTVSSFNTVTLNPHPVVSFNLKLPSRTWDAIHETQQFVVHVLASNSRGAAIAETFTRPYEQPHAGFLTLKEMGVQIGDVAAGSRPGKLLDLVGGGIETWLRFDLLPDKCIEIEDHIIVVGKLLNMSMHERDENRLALSYAMRGFRSGEGKIEPDYSPSGKRRSDHAASDHQASPNQVMPAEIERDPLKLGEEIDSDGAVSPDGASQSQKRRQESKTDEQFAGDSVYEALARTRETIRHEEAADAGEEHNDDNMENDHTPSHPQSETRNEGNSDSTVTSASTLHPTPAVPHTQIKRPFSTFARRPMDILRIPQQTRRFASTFTFSDANDLSAILDPSTAQSTVSDYLSTRDEKYKPDGKFDLYVYQSRVMHLIKNQKDIIRLRELLDRGYKVLDNGKEIPLTESEISSMNEKVISLERHVDIVLAINAHRMLREMLDKARYGGIFWRQVPEFERMVEKGMKVLMDVAKELRQELEEGKVSAEDFKKISVKLKGRYEGLEREILRLRSVTEEEGDEVFGDDDD